MLDPSAHLDQVPENVATGVLVRLDVHQSDGDQEVPDVDMQYILKTRY